jgi:uncharacterized membrane protein
MPDRVTQTTIGLFMATFIYICLVFLVTHQDATSRFVLQASLSWFLVVASFAVLVYYSHRIATSIQNPEMIARIADELYPAVVGSHRREANEATGPPPDDDAIQREADTGAVVPCPRSRYLQHIDHSALCDAGRDGGAMLVFHFLPGQFIFRGEPLASVVPATAAGSLERTIDRHTAIGRHRTITQDAEFGIAQMVGVAIRALSPAVNDTFTGVACRLACRRAARAGREPAARR